MRLNIIKHTGYEGKLCLRAIAATLRAVNKF
jgi:hypothetical protein